MTNITGSKYKEVFLKMAIEKLTLIHRNYDLVHNSRLEI